MEEGAPKPDKESADDALVEEISKDPKKLEELARLIRRRIEDEQIRTGIVPGRPLKKPN